jgi:hypothetical protein
MAVGEVGIPALHSAVLKPDLFSKTTLENNLISWGAIFSENKSFNQLVNVVHGALKYYDLPDLVQILGDKIVIKDPFDASGVSLEMKEGKQKYSDEPVYEGLAGILYGRINYTNPEYPDPVQDLDLSWDNKMQKRGRDWASQLFGYLISPFDGEVEITLNSNQKIEISIGGILEETLDYNTLSKTFRIVLNKDEALPLHINYSQDGVDKSYMKITWNKPGKPPEVITSEHLRYSPAQKFIMENDWK